MLITLLVSITVVLIHCQSICKDEDNTDVKKPNDIFHFEIENHSLAIYVYDDNVELKLQRHISQLFYSVIITQQDCIEKYEIISLRKLIEIIKSSINKNIASSDASYKIILMNDKEFSYLHFIISFNNYGKMETISFSLHVNNPTLREQTKIIDYLSTQINTLKNENKILKDEVNELKNIVPQFGIIMWYKCNDIPTGYKICDGTNQTPDLRGKFVVGGDNKHFKFNERGGSNEHNHGVNVKIDIKPHTLTVDEMPSHNHIDNAYKYLLQRTGGCTVKHTDSANGHIEPNLCNAKPMRSSGGNKAHKHDVITNSQVNTANNIPPYYVLCYIMKA